MTHALLPSLPDAAPNWRGLPARLARRMVLGRLEELSGGRLTVVEGRQRHVLGRITECHAGDTALDVTIEVRDDDFWVDLLLGGTVGAGEGWMAHRWECDDLVGLVRLLARNADTIDRMDTGIGTLRAPLFELYHRLRRNTRAGAERNIAAHYDLGNDFFAAFLDESMTYSAAVFESPDMTLAEAQRNKLDRLCRKLDLQAGDRLLEIGTGWGSLSLHAAGHYGCQVTTTTISRRQARLARERIAGAGLADRVEVLLSDYRDLTGRFDKLVSIEMIEAVGHEYLPDFFRTCAERLEPGGVMALQVILLPEHRYQSARQTTDFIKRYIFPGSQVPSLGALSQAWGDVSDFRLIHADDLTTDYARTLALWSARFREQRTAIAAMGYPEAFLRMWEFYLAYCEGGFAERYLSDAQLVLGRQATRHAVSY